LARFERFEVVALATEDLREHLLERKIHPPTAP
jgi:hypothetical protein